MNSENDKDLVISHFSGKTSALQKKMLDEWLSHKPNEELFYKWLHEYEKENPQYKVDLELGLKTLNKRLLKKETHEVGIVSKKQVSTQKLSRISLLITIAASITIILSLNIASIKEAILFKRYETKGLEKLSIHLIDGSKIMLMPKSQLKVPRFGFGNRSRQVFLTGEASFDVSHLDNHQKFIVKTEKDIDVVVLGTEFKVIATPQIATVLLNKGKVQLRYQEGTQRKALNMFPGEAISFDSKNKIEKVSANHVGEVFEISSQKFVFENTSLQEFANIINQKYGIHITFDDPTISKRTIEGSFHAENAEELLDIVCKIFDLKIIRQENKNEVILSNN